MALTIPVSSADHIQGNTDAVITLVEYGDYQCPYCGEAFPIVKQLQKHFGDKLRFVFRNFPLQEIHQFAVPAAMAAESAASQGKFWEMHDLLYENQESFSALEFEALAVRLGLNMTEFNKGMQDQTIAKHIEKDFEGGVRSGVNGTPSFFVNGEKYNESWDVQTFTSYLSQLL